MNRREFARLGWATVIGAGAGKLRPAFAESLALRHVPGPLQHPRIATSEPKTTGRAADFILRIAPMMVELAPQVVISTIGYGDKVPGPLLRVREGQRVTVEVVNDTDIPEYVHWHGLLVPSEVDGAEEEGTPPVPAHGGRRDPTSDAGWPRCRGRSRTPPRPAHRCRSPVPARRWRRRPGARRW